MADGIPFRKPAHLDWEDINRLAFERHEETKISSLFVLCNRFVEHFLSDLPDTIKGRINRFFSTHARGVGNPKHDLPHYVMTTVVPDGFDYEPKIYITEEPQKSKMRQQLVLGTWAALKRADDLAGLLIDKQDVPQTIVMRLLNISSNVHLLEMADYQEMCERYGLEHFQRILAPTTEIQTNLDPNNPGEPITLAGLTIKTRYEKSNDTNDPTQNSRPR